MEARRELEDDPDYSTYDARYQAKMKAAREAAAKLIRVGSDREIFDQEAGLDIERGRSEILKAAHGKEVVAKKATLVEGLEALRDTARDAIDDPTRTAAITTSHDLITGAVKSGVVDPLAATQMRENFASDIATDWASGALLREDVDAAQTVLDQYGKFIDWRTRLDLEGRVKSFRDDRTAQGDAARALGTVPAAPGTEARPAPSREQMFSTVIGIESNGQQFDGRGNPKTSSKGAIGIAQVMPATGPEAAKLAGLPWDPARFRNDAQYNAALGRAYFAKQLKTFGDPSMAAAAYNAGPGDAEKGTGVRGAIAKAKAAGKPDKWLDYLPKETRDYVAKFRAQVGIRGPQQAPERHDLNEIYSRIDSIADIEEWTPERRERAKREADKLVSRDELLANRQEDAAARVAWDTAEKLGDSFTSTNQIPNFASLDPQTRMSLEARAEANAKPKAVPADGRAVTDLKVLAARDPKTFQGMDLRPFEALMTPDEFSTLVVDQAKMRAKGDEPSPMASIRTEIDTAIRFYGKDIGLDIADRSDPAERAQYSRMTDLMRAYLQRATEGKRAPTDDDMKRAFDYATMQVVVPSGGWFGGKTAVPQYQIGPGQQMEIQVPNNIRDRIVSNYKATHGGSEPPPGVVGQTYIQYKGRPGYWN